MSGLWPQIGALLFIAFASSASAQTAHFDPPLRKGHNRFLEFQWRADHQTQVSPDDVRKFFNKIVDRLPPRFHDEFANKLQFVLTRDLGSDLVPSCAGVSTLVSAREMHYDFDQTVLNRIKINVSAFESAPRLKRRSPCHYGTIGDHLEGEVLNAIFRAYYLQMIDWKENEHWWPQFSHLAGWGVTGWSIFRYMDRANTNFERLIEENEGTSSISKVFALNAEYFLQDPEFSCRRPGIAAVFKRYFGVPGAKSNCRPSLEINITRNAPLDPSGADGAKVEKVVIDPSRVYQVHYLFAGKSDAIMSWWGHAMFRLVLCAPETKFGPDCLNDIEEHVVVSFRTNVNDVALKYLPALLGGYASKAFLLPYTQVYNDYIVVEDRELESYPLALSEFQKTEFVFRALEVYWGYSSSYYFLTNNCAVELGNFLKGVVDDKTLRGESFYSPVGLKDVLARSELIDLSILNNRQEANKLGYLMRPRPEVYEAAFSDAKVALGFSFPDLDYYLVKTTARERREAFEAAVASGRVIGYEAVMGLEMLEKKIMQRANYSYLHLATEKIFSEIEAGNPETRTFAKLEDDLKAPRCQITKYPGYGIPLESDLVRPTNIESLEDRVQMIRDANEWVQKALKADFDAVIDSNQLFYYFKGEKRRLMKISRQ